MAKKKAATATKSDPKPAALAALGVALEDPAPRVLFGTSKVAGFFTGSGKPVKEAATFCQEQGWLEGTGEFQGSGKAKKELFRVTDKGLQGVISATDPQLLLQRVRTVQAETVTRCQSALNRIREDLPQLDGSATEALRAAETGIESRLRSAASDFEKTLDELRAFAGLQTAAQAVKGAVETTTAEARRTIVAEQARLHDLEARLQHTVTEEQNRLEALANGLAKRLEEVPQQVEARPAEPARPAADWLDEVVRLAAEQRQRNPHQNLSFPEVYREIRKRHPSLTLAEFHDGLRTLYKQRRISLWPYTLALATIDDSENALFLDREVKYYVDLP
jgi:hypothetical protein